MRVRNQRLWTHGQEVLKGYGTWPTPAADWEFWLSPQLPQADHCGSAACVAIDMEQSGVVLTRTDRGWHLLGGHQEPGESVIDTCVREAYEEGGYIITPPRLDGSATADESLLLPFGYRKITNIAVAQTLRSSTGRAYSVGTSYAPHFVATTNYALGEVTGSEVFESDVFTPPELREMAHEGSLPIGDFMIVKLGLAAAARHGINLT